MGRFVRIDSDHGRHRGVAFPVVGVGTVTGIPDSGSMCSCLFRATPRQEDPAGQQFQNKPPSTEAAGTHGASRPDPHNATKTPQRPPAVLIRHPQDSIRRNKFRMDLSLRPFWRNCLVRTGWTLRRICSRDRTSRGGVRVGGRPSSRVQIRGDAVDHRAQVPPRHDGFISHRFGAVRPV